MVNWSHVQTLSFIGRGQKALLVLAIMIGIIQFCPAGNNGSINSNIGNEVSNKPSIAMEFNSQIAPPVNDDCLGPTPIPSVGSVGNCTQIFGTTVDANLSRNFPCEFPGEVFVDVWYVFQITDVPSNLTFTSGTGTPYAVVYNDPSCVNYIPFNDGCLRGSGTIKNLPPGVYSLQILTLGSSGSNFDFCLEIDGTPPSNNDCNNASSIQLGAPIALDASYATTELVPSCVPVPYINMPDLWYTFTAPSTMEIAFSNTSTQVLLSIYSGTCATLNSISCTIPIASPPTNLTPGQTYYAQISFLGTENSTEETITAPGNFTFTGANSNNWSDGTNWQSGTPPPGTQPVTLSTGTNCTMDVNVTMNSSLNLESGSSLIIDQTLTLNNTLTNNGDLDLSGTLKGNGTLVQNGSLTSTGTLAPGLSPGTLTITGDYDMDGTTFDCEINGTTAGTEYDVINVSGNATLDGGTLNVTWGFTPAHGQTFEILSCGSRTGSFSTVNIPSLPNRTFTVNYLPLGVSILSQSSLPVEFLSFTGAFTESGEISLNWQTGTETDNKGFEIQRLERNNKWVTIGFIPGYGNSTITREYHFMDYEPATGNNYYRIRQIDFDGTDAYSRTIAIEATRTTEPMSIYPNPANNSVTIDIPEDTVENGIISLTDINQKKIQQLSLENRNNYGKTDIDLTNLPSGIYFLHLQTAKISFTKRLVVQHNHN